MASMLAPQQVKSRLAEQVEMALIDVREHGEYGERHPFHSVNIPFSRFELELSTLVPNFEVMLVLFDEADEGRAQQCAQAAQHLGYRSVFVMSGGALGWQRAGYTLFSGVHVPSKTFGELVEHHFHTPSISAKTLAEWQAQNKRLTLLDGRTEQEYHQRAIPHAHSCPNGELALRANTMIVDQQAPVVIHCAGRTRSIIGAETLRQLSPNLQVYALENGTQGWELAGLKVAEGLTDYYPQDVQAASAQVSSAQQWALRQGARPLSIEAVKVWLQDPARTTYVLDVRTQKEYQAQPFSGAVHAPGGQLIQATDLWVGVRHARIILLSDDGCRAPVVAGWLGLMGYTTAWFDGSYQQWQDEQPCRDLKRPVQARVNWPPLNPQDVFVHNLQLLDTRTSSAFQQGHYAGSVWVNRSSLASQVRTITPKQALAIVASSPEHAELVAAPLREAGFEVAGWLPFSLNQTTLKGVSSVAELPRHERIDYLFFVHDRHQGNLKAAEQYLAWEIGLVKQLDPQERASFRL